MGDTGHLYYHGDDSCPDALSQYGRIQDIYITMVMIRVAWRLYTWPLYGGTQDIYITMVMIVAWRFYTLPLYGHRTFILPL